MNGNSTPIALYPDELGYIFSGSAVVGHENTSGFGKDGQVPIIAIYTYHDPKGEEEGNIDFQTQGIAYSLDEGMTWTKYDLNPVIKNPDIKAFRDPKVFWDTQHNKWVMVLTGGDKAMFYGSKDLINWELLSTFGENFGAHGGVWECPDLFYINVEGSDQGKWVLMVSINPGGPNEGSATQYFVGNFDGTQFVLDKDSETALNATHASWIDFGKDNYAGVTWSNIPATDGRRIFIGMMVNLQYAEKVQTEEWRSTMTIAREIKLIKNEDNYKLTFNPIRELNDYKVAKYQQDNIAVNDKFELINSETIDLSRSVINFSLSDIENKPFKITLSNSKGDALDFGYDPKVKHFLLIDLSLVK